MNVNSLTAFALLLDAMEQDNGCSFDPTIEQVKDGVTAIEDMKANGVEFPLAEQHDLDSIYWVIAGGDQDEAEDKYGKIPGYQELSKVLNEIFNADKEILEFENAILTGIEQYLPSASAYADDIFDQLPKEEMEYLKALPEDQLSSLHHSWGRGIRNGCGLWDKNHPLTTHWHNFPAERDMRDGVDYSKDHPDSVSMQIMKLIHKKVNA